MEKIFLAIQPQPFVFLSAEGHTYKKDFELLHKSKRDYPVFVNVIKTVP